MRVHGGKALYGASLGILMLDAQFPRIPGDMGHAGSWDFPVHYRIVRGADPDRVVRGDARALRDRFIAEAQALEADGVDGITTNCGFLSLLQDDIAAAVRVPVATSSLLQVSMVNRILPRDLRAAILTISASTLTGAHLRAAHVPDGTPIGTTEGGREFTKAILGNADSLDIDAAREDNVEAARRLMADHDGIGAIVLECTNMTPYAADIRAAAGVPVYTVISFANWFRSGLTPRRWAAP